MASNQISGTHDLDPDWQTWFEPQILLRGQDYFNDDAVALLTTTTDGWTASVSGTDVYEVFVPSADVPLNPTCTCPYFAEGGLCKHIAATYYAIEDAEEHGEQSVEVNEANEDEIVERIIDNLDVEELRRFVKSLAKGSKHFSQRIISEFGMPDSTYLRTCLLQDLTRIVLRYEYGGFIDYENSLAFELEVCHTLIEAVDPLLRTDTLLVAFDVTTTFLLFLESIQIDDSNGFFTSATESVVRCWTRIFDVSKDTPDGLSVREAMFSWLSSFIDENPVEDRADVYWFLADAATDFLMDQFTHDPAFSDRLLGSIDDAIAQEPLMGKTIQGTEFINHKLKQLVLRRLNIMEARNESIAERFAFAEPYLSIPEIRMIFVNAAKERGDYLEAIRLLEEGKASMNTDESRNLLAFTAELAELYEKTDQIIPARQEITTLVENGRSYGIDAVYWYEKLKQLTPADEWPEIRDGLYASMNDTEYYHACLAVEGLYSELMDSIEATRKGINSSWYYPDPIWEIKRYKDELFPRFPERLLRLYRKSIEARLVNTGKRDTYRSAVALLNDMAEIEGGVLEARKLAAFLRQSYPRRRALMDELQKAGW